MGGSPRVSPEVNYVLKRLRPTMPAFDTLKEESRLEGYGMLVRLADGWASDRNKFLKRGEALYGAWHGRELAGVCGLNIDRAGTTAGSGTCSSVCATVAPALAGCWSKPSSTGHVTISSR